MRQNQHRFVRQPMTVLKIIIYYYNIMREKFIDLMILKFIENEYLVVNRLFDILLKKKQSKTFLVTYYFDLA